MLLAFVMLLVVSDEKDKPAVTPSTGKKSILQYLRESKNLSSVR